MLDIDGAEGGYMCGDRVYGNSVQSTQFYHESKTALKQVYYLKEKKNHNELERFHSQNG